MNCLQPSPLIDPAAKCRTRNAGRRHPEHHLVADPPPLAHPGLGQIEPPGREVLPEEPVRELAVQSLLPTIQILPGEGVHRLTVAAVVLRVADEVTDQPLPRPPGLGPGARTSTGPDCGCLAMPVALVSLYGLGWGRPRLTEWAREPLRDSLTQSRRLCVCCESLWPLYERAGRSDPRSPDPSLVRRPSPQADPPGEHDHARQPPRGRTREPRPRARLRPAQAPASPRTCSSWSRARRSSPSPAAPTARRHLEQRPPAGPTPPARGGPGRRRATARRIRRRRATARCRQARSRRRPPAPTPATGPTAPTC